MLLFISVNNNIKLLTNEGIIMHLNIHTEIVINATADRVYDILTGLRDYSKWNPFIVKSEGDVQTGRRIKNTMKNGEKLMNFKPIVLAAERGKKFEWRGSLFIRGLFDGHHYFRIEEISDNQINLIHGENFSGILAPFILRKIGEQTRNNFIVMNRALKAEAEKQF